MNNGGKGKDAWNKFNKGWDKVNQVMRPLSEATNKGMDKANEVMHKSSEKTVNQLNDFQLKNKTISCPRCKQTNVTFMENDKKGFSVGKAVGGSLLAGRVGLLAGFAGKKGKKNKFHCNNCGYTFLK